MRAVSLVPQAIDNKTEALRGRLKALAKRMRIGALDRLWRSQRYLIYNHIRKEVERDIAELKEKKAWAQAARTLRDKERVYCWALEQDFQCPAFIAAMKHLVDCLEKVKEERDKLTVRALANLRRRASSIWCKVHSVGRDVVVPSVQKLLQR